MNTLSYRTKSASPADVTRAWHIIDAEDVVLGRLATRAAHILRGKNKPYFTPHEDCGDYIIVINAEKVKFTGNKKAAKEYITFSGYPSGQKRITAEKLMVKKPTKPIEAAVKGMLPKTKMGRKMFKKLFVYAGADHPHAAQQPKEIKI